MGKRTKTRRMGKGSIFTSGVGKAEACYIPLNESTLRGQVLEIYSEPGHTGIMAEIQMEDGKEMAVMAAEGIKVGQWIVVGKEAELKVGNVLPLSQIAEGCPVFVIERLPGDGGVFARGSGMYGLVMGKDGNGVLLKLPSGKSLVLDPRCRATIGNSAGGGRIEKPMVKAGNAYHWHHARKKAYPDTRGVAMNPVSHPFGGSQHHAGKSKSVSRHAPPGRKVGAIASKRTGRKKK
ncbi:MAG: 50S ribosomal protein L2 [Candidatus Diapherotrites archaeon]